MGAISDLIRKEKGHWASVKLLESYVEKCAFLLTALESDSHRAEVRPESCFELWSKLGDLRHGIWSDLTPFELTDLASKTKELVLRTNELLASKRKESLVCLESGMLKALKKAEKSKKEVEHFLNKGEIGGTLTSAEVNAGILYWRDQMGFVSLLLEEQNLEISPNVKGKLERLDTELKTILLETLKAFRKVNDDPTPYPERFPPSFWWRRIS